MVPIPADAANPGIGDLARLVRAAPPRLGGRRLVLVDGPAGSGKTTLAARLGEALGAPVLHGDDMYEGWTGLGTLWAVLGEQVLEPLARGESAAFRAWDWERSERGHVIEVPGGHGARADALVIEGVGVAQRRARPYSSLVVYVEAPWEVRLVRGIERDGQAMRADWERWQAGEARFLEAEGTRAAADVLIDGTRPVPDGHEGGDSRDMRIAPLSSHPALITDARELVGEYFRLPDAWPDGSAPEPMPQAFLDAVARHPGDAVPPRGEALVALVGDDPAGQLLLVPHAAGEVRLERMYVRPAHRRQGVGRMLLSAALDAARGLGYRRAVCDVLPSRRDAIALYEAQGFHRIPSYADKDPARVCLGVDLHVRPTPD